MQTLRRHRTSITLTLMMVFAIALYLFIVPILTEKTNAPTLTPVNKVWKWEITEYTNDITVVPRDTTTFNLSLYDSNNANKMLFHAATDCNAIEGEYTLDTQTNNLSFIKEKSHYIDKTYCEGAQADDYFEMLGKVQSYTITDKKLTLSLNDNEGTMTFVLNATIQTIQEPPKPEPDDIPPSPLVLLQQNEWTWQETTLPDETTIKPEDATQFVLQFQDDEIRSSTDCNTINGTVTAYNNTLTFHELSITEKGCPESQDTSYYDHLHATKIYSIEDSMLTLIAEDGTTMLFTSIKPSQEQ